MFDIIGIFSAISRKNRFMLQKNPFVNNFVVVFNLIDQINNKLKIIYHKSN